MADDVLIIYADELILINFCIDFICLFISGRICGLKISALRLAVAAILGGAYTLTLALSLSPFLTLPMNVASALAICLVAFAPKPKRVFFKVSAVFAVTAALIGGLTIALLGLFGIAGLDRASLLLTLPAAALISLLFLAFSRKRSAARSMRAEVETVFGIFEAELLIDSGNLATEPFSGLPIIIVSSAILPPPLKTASPENSPVPLRAIPIRTAAGSDIMYGFFPTNVVLFPNGKPPKTVKAIIGIGKESDYGGYCGLLPAVLV